jgi:hypothetical protein
VLSRPFATTLCCTGARFVRDVATYLALHVVGDAVHRWLALLPRFKLRFGPIKIKWFAAKEPDGTATASATSQPFTFEVPQPPKSAPRRSSEPDFLQEETTHIVDPFVEMPDVYRKPVSWEMYYEPTWKRRQIDLKKVLDFTPATRKELLVQSSCSLSSALIRQVQ